MACQRKSSSSVKQQQEQLKDAASPTPPSPFEDTERYLWRLGCSRDLPEAAAKAHFLPDLIRKTLKVEVVERGRVSFSFPVIPQLTNLYNTLHGGAVAAVAEVAAQACLMTVAGDREFFLGESAVTYLSAARANAELDIEGRVLRQGRNVIVASVEFKIKKTQQLAYIAHFTFYNLQSAKL